MKKTNSITKYFEKSASDESDNEPYTSSDDGSNDNDEEYFKKSKNSESNESENNESNESKKPSKKSKKPYKKSINLLAMNQKTVF